MILSSNFPDVLFLLSSLVIGPNFMSISPLVLELSQFSFIRDWPEIRKSKISPSEFYPISGDWGKLGIPNFVLMLLIKCYWVLQNTRVTAFTISELLESNLSKKSISGLKSRKIIWAKCPKKEYYWLNTEKMNNTIDLCIFKLV